MNDALALAGATVGAAMGAGSSEVAIEAADVALMNNDLESLVHLRHLSRQSLRIIDQIFWIATVTNMVGIGFGALGLNGGEGFKYRISKLAENLAATPLGNFWISMDSAIPSVHEEMRGLRGVVAGIEKALRIFEEFGIYPSANLGINRNIGGRDGDVRAVPRNGSDTPDPSFHENMKEGFRKFYRLVIQMGFTIVNTCYPMSVEPNGGSEDLNAVYRATSTSSIVRFSRAEKAALFKALMDVIPEFRSRIRIFSPLSSLYSLHKYYRNPAKRSYPCLGGIDSFYIGP